MGFSRLLLLCFFVASAVAVPVTRREQCARHCTESNQFVLNPGTTYIYDYETTTVTTIKGTTQDKSQLQMTAQADIEVLSKCELALRLRGVTLKQSDPLSPEYLKPVRGGREFSRAVESQIVKFSYQDGRIADICPSGETPAWITNIHRGVLSAFQTSMANLEGDERVIETDVSGMCSAEYKSLGRSWRGTITIRKVKDLNACSDRQNAVTALQSTPFTQGLGIESLPIVTGTQECEQSIGSGILQSSSCTEKHVFRPFSQSGSGAVTTVTQKLTYNTIMQRSFVGDDYRPTRNLLLFDHEYENAYPGQEEREAESAMIELCEASSVDMAITVPNKFADVVYRMRKLNYDSLGSLFRKLDTLCPSNSKARKFFTDAVPLLSTSNSVRFMTDMILRLEVPQSEISYWLTSLAFISEPTADMISTITPLLDERFEQGFLGVSALIHTFCKENDCSRSSEVRDAVYKLVAYLGDNCYSSEDKKVLLTLKALGNIGFLFGREAVLERCYKNPQIDTELRIAAIQTYRRLSCDVSREHFLTTYGNYDDDSEIRIASYLASMHCLNQETIQYVKDTLERESVNQVGSFVWTHLNALSKSKHPERRDIRDILVNLYLLNKYNVDVRKFSSAHEASMFLESINSGFHADSHLIFSPESYLPRSASFNLTVDIFGRTCNLFQIDGRMEGLENVVEKFFGPSGYFPQRNVAKLLRERRSISDNKIETFDEQFDMKSRFAKQPYGSLDMKIFGNTLLYSQFGRGSDDDATSMNFLDLISDLADEQEREFSRSFMFMDTTFTIPLASGMPLRLAVNGTATVGLKIGGKFNVRSFKHVDILGHFEPSGAVEIASLMTVDAGTTARAGLRMIGTLHSSSVLDGAVEVRDGQVFKVKLNMPRDKIDLIDIQSKIFLVHGPEETEQQGATEDRTYINSCTGQSAKKIFGVELCTEIRLPGSRRNTPLYPINGPATFSVFIRKTDPSLTSYTFDSLWSKEEVNGQYIRRGVISLNTPGSSKDREISAELVYDQPDRAASFRLKTPFKKFGMNAKFENEESLKKLDLSLTVDEVTKFSLLSEFKVNADSGGVRYSPSLEIRIPSRRIAYVTGSAYLKHGQKYNAQLNVEHLTEKPITLRGNLDIKNSRYEGKVSLSSYALDTTVEGYTQLGDTSSCRFTVDYRIMEGRNFKVAVNGKLRDLSASALMKHNGVLNIQATALPEWDTALSWETMKTSGHFENTLSISIGDGIRSRIHTINLQEIIRYHGELLDNNAAVTLKLSYPEKNIDYTFDMKHENTRKTLKNTMVIQYAQNKEISSLVDISAGTSNSLALSGDIKVDYPGRETRLTAQVVETSSNEYRASILTQWQRRRQMKLTGNYKDKSDNSGLKYEVDAELNLPGHLPFTLEAEVNSNRGKFAGSVQTNFGREKYRLNAEYLRESGPNHRITSQLAIGRDLYSAEASLVSLRDKVTGMAEIKFPNRRRITAKVDVQNSHIVRAITLESMWDADRDQSRRFAFATEIRPKASGFDGKATVQILRRTVNGVLSCSTVNRLSGNSVEMSHRAELSWSPNEKVTASLTTSILMTRSRHQINGNLDVTTPFQGYESVTVNIAHSDSDQQWNSEVTASLARTNYITLITSGKYSVDRYGTSLYTNTKLQTPFTNWESVSLDLTHARGPSEMSSRAEIQWSYDKKIAAGIFGSLAGNEFRGGANLTTPFVSVRDMYTSVSHTFSSGSYKTKGEFQWAPREKITVDFDGRTTFSNKRRTCSVNLVTVTPFRGYEALSGKVVYNNDGSSLSTDTEVNINREKIALGFTGTARNSPHNKNVDGKLYFTSPYLGYERLEISTTLQTTDSTYKTNVDAKLPHRMAASLNSQGKMTSFNDVELNVVVSGKFNNYLNFQRASVDFAHKLQDPNLRSSLDLVYNSKQMTILLTGRSNSPVLEGTLTVNTPFRGFEEMKLDVRHTRRSGQCESRIQFSKNSESLLLEHEFKLNGPYTFDASLRLTSSFSGISDFKTSVTQEYTDSRSAGKLVRSRFQHNIEMEWARMKKTVLNILYQNNSPSKDLRISLTTPYHELREIEVSAIYEERRQEIKPSLIVLWNGNRMAVESSFSNYRMQKVEGTITYTSSFYGHELYGLSSKYDMRHATKIAEIEFKWDRRTNKVVSLRGNYIPEDQKASAEIILSTPFDGFEQMTVIGNYENQRHEKSASLVYQRGLKKISMNGKSITNTNGAEFEINFNSPYKHAKDLSMNAKYSNIGRQLSGEASVQWDNDRQIQVSSDLTLSNNDAIFKAKIQSPYRQISLYSQYKKDFRSYNAEIKLQSGPSSIYHANGVIKHNGQFPTEISVTIDTPNSPFRNVRFTTNVNHQTGHHELTSNLQWEGKEMNAHFLLRNRDLNFFETKLSLNTPFHNFRALNFEGSLKSDRNLLIDGRLNLQTPFETLRTLDLTCVLRSTGDGYNFNFDMNSPSKKLAVTSHVKNSRFQPFEAKITIEAPFTSFQTLTVSSRIESYGLPNTKASVSLVNAHSTHSVEASFKKEESKIELDVQLMTPLLKNGESKFGAKCDYSDLRSLSGEVFLTGIGGDHSLELKSRSTRRDQEMEIKVNSLLLPGKSATTKIIYSYRRSRYLDAKLILSLSSSRHQLSCRYEIDNRQLAVTSKVESDLLPFHSLETEAKYINVNGRDINLSLLASTPSSKHSFTANLKNYDAERSFELKIESPSVKVAPLTISGSLKNDLSNMEGVLTISHRSQEFRIAGNVNRVRSESVEAMVAVNTPFECLRMMRIDAKAARSGYDSLEGSFQVETSNPEFRKLSFSAKMGSSSGSQDISINIQLPNTKYHTLGLLANVHYNEDFTSVAPRVTLSLPQRGYSLYGDYKFSREFSLQAGCSWAPNQKLELSTTFKPQRWKNFEAQVSVKTPFQGYEQYEYILSYKSDRRRHEVILDYKNPQNKAVNAKGTLEMTSSLNFVAEGTLSSTFPSLKDVSARIMQSFDGRNFETNVEYICGREKTELKLSHQFGNTQNTHHQGTIQIRSPFRALRELKTSYSLTASAHERQVDLNVHYNRVKQFGAQVILNVLSAEQKQCKMILDLPRIPFKLQLSADSSHSEQKFSLETATTTRTVSFSTMLQDDSSVVLHETSFSWDKEPSKRISYILKSANTQTRNFRGKDLYGRLDFPLRSFEVKGKIADSGQSFGFDLFYDAARDSQKRMTFGYDHHDITTREQAMNRIRLSLTHPSLQKEIVLTNVLTVNNQEIHFKSDLEYSRYQQHHLSLEMRGSRSVSRREHLCKGELSFKHPASNVDVRVVGELANGRDDYSFYARLHNMDNQQMQRIKEFRSKVTKSSKAVHIMLRSDDNQINFIGRQANSGYEIVVTPNQDASDDSNIYSSILLTQSDDSLDVKITVPKSGVLQISAAYPLDSMSFKIAHTTSGKAVTDVYVFLGLEQSRILRSRINWRPGMLRQIQYQTREHLNYLSHSLQQKLDSVSTSLKEEFDYKSGLMRRHANQQLMPVIRDAKAAVNEISTELIAGRDSIYLMYRNNEFYMKDIALELQRIIRAIDDGFGYLALGLEVLSNIVVDYLEERYYDIYYAIEDFLVNAMATYKNIVYRLYRFKIAMEKTMYRTWRRALSAMDHAVDYAIRNVEILGESLLANIDSILRNYAPFIIDAYYYAKNTADFIRETIKSTTDKITSSVTNSPIYIALSEYWTKVVATLEAFRKADVLNTVNQQLLRQYSALRDTAQGFMDRISDLNLVETVMNHPHVEYVGDITNRALIKGLEVYNTLGIDAMVKSLLHTGFEYARDAAFDTAQELLQELYQLKSGAKYSIEPERGLISFEYSLPVARNSLAEVLDIYSYPEYRKFNNFKDTLFTKYYEDFCIWDMYYSVKKYFSPRYWIPLTPAHAMIAGNQHFITFDKFSFDFASECSYLLTRDFVDGNFSVVVNYGRHGRKAVRKSLTILSEGKKFEVSNDYKVTVDDIKVEMPLQRESTIVTREGSNVRVENEQKGFVIVCNFVHDVCTLGMSSFYFGKTGGLFGTYDYEPRLDMMTPQKQITTEVETFVNSWEVGASTCRRSSNMATIPGNDIRVQRKCKELFGTSSSIFRACFKQVDPEPYMNMCISDLSAVHENQFDSTICTAAAAYWTECKINGVPLKMPKSCVRCETADQRVMTEGDVVKFTKDDPLHTADIVFVVEEKPCNRDKYKILIKLAQSIEEAFTKKGYRDIRYSVIGFGGDTIHAKPHIHTMDGQISGTVRAVDSAFQSLEVGNGPVNVLEALRYAAALPFRPGTTKNFILLKCSTCKAEEVRAEYSEMLRTLLDGDITLHLLMRQNFEMKGTNQHSKAKKVIGIDKNFAYTLKDLRDSGLSGDEEMLTQLKIPKDVCVPLALEVNGSSFDSQQLLEQKKKIYKKFIDILSHRIQKTASERSEWAMCCECLSTVEGVGKSMCQRCVSAEVADMISPESSPFYNEISNNINDSNTGS